MADATIIYERTVTDEQTGEQTVVTVDMANWPPTTWLVQLNPPLRRFDPETGAATDYEYVAVNCKDSDPRASYVFPSTAEGGFVDPTMTPMRTRDYGTPAAVLAQIGYDVTA